MRNPLASRRDSTRISPAAADARASPSGTDQLSDSSGRMSGSPNPRPLTPRRESGPCVGLALLVWRFRTPARAFAPGAAFVP